MNFNIDVDDTKLRLRLEQLPAELQANLKAKITELTHQLLRMVLAREPVRTGRLRQQTHAFVDERQNFVRGRVRILPVRTRANRTAAAFGALEYGSTGRRFPVRGYTSQGRRVGPYQRAGGIRAQRFLRGPAAVMLPRARMELLRIVSETVKDK